MNGANSCRVVEFHICIKFRLRGNDPLLSGSGIKIRQRLHELPAWLEEGEGEEANAHRVKGRDSSVHLEKYATTNWTREWNPIMFLL